MLKLVIFDLDGTLMDAYEAIYRSFNYTMERIGCPCREEQVIRRAVGWGDRNLLKPFVRARDLDAALAIYRRHHAVSLRENTRLFPGVKGMLAGLRKKGVRLAVASNRPTRFSLIALNALGIRKNFDYVLCADKVKRGKPWPDILRKIMARLKAGPEQTVYAGDMAIDVQAARAAGVWPVAVTTGSNTPAQLRKERPFAVIRRIRELPAILRRLERNTS